MSKALKVLLSAACLISLVKGHAQEHTLPSQPALDSIYNELDLLFSDEDELSMLIRLTDSLLMLENQKTNALSVHSGYISNILTAGRDFGINQHGFSGGATYFHHSDFYTGVSGYWNSEYEPNYFMTNWSLGYMRTLWKKFYLNLSHDFYFYNDTLETNSFNKSLLASLSYQGKFYDIGGDYTFLYGNKTAHRVNGGANLDFSFRNVWFFDRIRFFPGAHLQWGNNDVLFFRQIDTPLREIYEIASSGNYPELTYRDYLRLGYLLKNERYLATYRFLNEKGFSQEDIERLTIQYQENQIEEANVFGLLNYSFSVPVSFSKGNWSLMCNYTYNIPVTLPNELYEYPQNSYFSLSVTHSFIFRK